VNEEEVIKALQERIDKLNSKGGEDKGADFSDAKGQMRKLGLQVFHGSHSSLSEARYVFGRARLVVGVHGTLFVLLKATRADKIIKMILSCK
jgi:hypothetical protein